MIANFIADGKKVLFLAEKQPALDVVADRLKQAGLGSLMFEASKSSRKDELLSSIKQRLELEVDFPARDYEYAKTEIRKKIEFSNKLKVLLFAETPYLNLDLYRLFWKYINTKDFLGKEKIRGVGVVPDELESVTNESLEKFKDILSSIIFQKHNQAPKIINDIKSPQISPIWLEAFMESAEG